MCVDTRGDTNVDTRVRADMRAGARARMSVHMRTHSRRPHVLLELLERFLEVPEAVRPSAELQ